MIKRKVILMFLIFCFYGCNSNSLNISPILMDKIKLTIDEFEIYAKKNENIMINPSIYSVDFSKLDDDCFITISTSLLYFPEMNTCTLYNDNLIAFYNVDKDCNNFVRINDSAFVCEEAKGYEKADTDISPYRPKYWIYKVLNDSLVLYKSSSLKK